MYVPSVPITADVAARFVAVWETKADWRHEPGSSPVSPAFHSLQGWWAGTVAYSTAARSVDSRLLSMTSAAGASGKGSAGGASGEGSALATAVSTSARAQQITSAA